MTRTLRSSFYTFVATWNRKRRDRSASGRANERRGDGLAPSLPPSLTPIPLIRFAASPSPVSGAERDAGTRPLAKAVCHRKTNSVHTNEPQRKASTTWKCVPNFPPS